MGTSNIMEQTLKEIIEVLTPSLEDAGERFQIINDLQGVVQSVESLRGDFCFIVHPFYFPPFFYFATHFFTRHS